MGRAAWPPHRAPSHGRFMALLKWSRPLQWLGERSPRAGRGDRKRGRPEHQSQISANHRHCSRLPDPLTSQARTRASARGHRHTRTNQTSSHEHSVTRGPAAKRCSGSRRHFDSVNPEKLDGAQQSLLSGGAGYVGARELWFCV